MDTNRSEARNGILHRRRRKDNPWANVAIVRYEVRKPQPLKIRQNEIAVIIVSIHKLATPRKSRTARSYASSCCVGSEMLSVAVMSFGRSAQTIARIGISNSRQIARDVGTREQTNVVGGSLVKLNLHKK